MKWLKRKAKPPSVPNPWHLETHCTRDKHRFQFKDSTQPAFFQRYIFQCRYCKELVSVPTYRFWYGFPELRTK